MEFSPAGATPGRIAIRLRRRRLKSSAYFLGHKKNRPATVRPLTGSLFQSVGGKMEPLGETRESQRATAQAFK